MGLQGFQTIGAHTRGPQDLLWINEELLAALGPNVP